MFDHITRAPALEASASQLGGFPLSIRLQDWPDGAPHWEPLRFPQAMPPASIAGETIFDGRYAEPSPIPVGGSPNTPWDVLFHEKAGYPRTDMRVTGRWYRVTRGESLDARIAALVALGVPADVARGVN